MTSERIREVGRKQKNSARALEKTVVENTNLASSERCTVKGQCLLITVSRKGSSTGHKENSSL